MSISRRHFALLSGATWLAACTPGSAPVKHRSDVADVIILGAGLSGLHAARMLIEAGLRVVLLEAAARPGGRMNTLDEVPGKPEAGGQQVGQTYARIRKAGRDLGIRILPFPKRPPDLTLSVNGRLMPVSDWATAKENPFPDALRASPPGSALSAAAMLQNPFTDDQSWLAASEGADVSAHQFLESLGFDNEALRLAGHTLNGNSLETYSMANLWRSLKILEKEMALGASERVEGGSARLTDAMAASLPKGTLRLNMPVTELHDRGNHVECISGGKSFTAPFAVCTLPFTALRSEKMRLSFSQESEAVALQRNAISSLPYTRIVQVHVVPKEPFWEKDGLPTEMWTDGPIERVFTNFDDQGGVKSLTCWINGDGARLDLSQSGWQQLVESEFARIRQASIEIAKIVRWDETNPYAGGAYMHWAPGQIAQWAGKMGATSGRLYFAGEHVSFLHTGMEGAMESAEIAVVGLLEAADR